MEHLSGSIPIIVSNLFVRLSAIVIFHHSLIYESSVCMHLSWIEIIVLIIGKCLLFYISPVYLRDFSLVLFQRNDLVSDLGNVDQENK